MVIVVSPLPVKAAEPIEVTLSGIIIDVRFEQLLKARFPIIVVFWGSCTDAKFTRPANMKSEILLLDVVQQVL